MINNQVIALLNISLQGRETMKNKPIREKDFSQTHFQQGKPSSHRAISEFTGMIDQTREDIDGWCCDSLEGLDCPEELKQKCFEQSMSLPNSMTVS